MLGDWIYLREGDEVQMEVLIGEEPGGGFHCQLYIQQEKELSDSSRTKPNRKTNFSYI